MKKLSIINSNGVKIIWTLERHCKNILRIEKDSFDEPWDSKELSRRINTMVSFSLSAELNGLAVGYVVYNKEKTYIKINRMAVQENFRRKSIGIQLLYKIFEQMDRKKQSNISVIVPDNNLSGQLFFQNAGFIATEILENKYLMQYYI